MAKGTSLTRNPEPDVSAQGCLISSVLKTLLHASSTTSRPGKWSFSVFSTPVFAHKPVRLRVLYPPQLQTECHFNCMIFMIFNSYPAYRRKSDHWGGMITFTVIIFGRMITFWGMITFPLCCVHSPTTR